MRATLLSFLALVAAVAAGLWYWQERSESPVATPSEAASPAGGDPTETAGIASPADTDQTGDSGAAPRTGTPEAAGSDTASPVEGAQTTDSGPAVEPADRSGTREAVLSPAPPVGAVGRVPVDPPAEDATGQTDVLAAVEDAIERVGGAVRERFVTEPETGPDTPGTATQAGAGQADAAEPGAGSAQTAEQIAHADVAASTAAPSPNVAGSGGAEAKQYVDKLTATTPRIIPVDKAAHFATGEHTISLIPEDTIESVSVAELVEDEALQPETPITVVREVEQMETAVPQQLIAEAGGDLDTTLRVTVQYPDPVGGAEQGDATGAGTPATVEDVTVREVLERIRSEPAKPISIVKTVRYFEVMTLRELLDTEQDADTFLNVVTQPYRIEAATLADLLQRQTTGSPGSIFYLHTVQPTDEQGIWGIVHSGLIDNFARGVAVERGEASETYKVQIPRDADERLEDQSSSFLGGLIDRKTKESFVYNYRDNRMGRNPDRIHPGQELVIINFEPEELFSIYEHFTRG